MINKIYIKYILAGIVNTIFGYLVFALFISLKCHYTIAVLIATIIGIFFNFVNLGHFVFSNKPWNKFHTYIIIYGILYVMNICGLYALNNIGINLYISNAILILPLAAIGFVLNRKFIYNF